MTCGSITDVAVVWRSMHSNSGRVPSSTPERSWHPLLLSGGAPICQFLGKKLDQNRGLYTLFLARSVSRKCSCSCSGSCSQLRRRPADTLPRVPCLPRPRRAYAEATANCIRNKRACVTTAGARNQLVAHHAGAGAGANDSYADSSAARARATGFVQPPHGTVDIFST